MKSTKKSLIASALSLVLCVSMLLGTTYAWFTDSVTSGKNKIIAGNLDVELKHYTTSAASATDVQGETDLFDVDLWEPGKVAFENFVISNEGTLAFKYNMAMAVADYNELNGHNLLEVLKVAIIDNGAFGDRNEDGEINRDDVTGLIFDKSLSDFTDTGWLAPKGNTAGDPSSKTFGVVIYWEPTDHDNDYNANNDQVTSDGDPLFVELGVNVIATQKDYEKDSFDEKYDLQAPLNSLASIINVEAKGKIKASIGGVDVTGDIIIKDEGETKVTAKIPSTTVSDFKYSGVDKDGIPFEMKSSDANEDGHDDTLILTIKTDKVEANSITYDISMVNDTHDEKIKKTNKVVSVSANIGSGLVGVKVTHNGTPMQEANTGDNQTYHYNPETGILDIYTDSFSPFEVSWNSDFPYAEVTKYTLPGDANVYNVFNDDGSLNSNVFGNVLDGKADYTTKLACAYDFKATETSERNDGKFGNWHADFVISFDKDIKKGSAGLWGSYFGFDNIGFLSPLDVKKGEKVRLIGSLAPSMCPTYYEICNNIKDFYCGAFNCSNENIGTTMTVELRLYPTEGSAISGINGETHDFVTVGVYRYTFTSTQTLVPVKTE